MTVFSAGISARSHQDAVPFLSAAANEFRAIDCLKVFTDASGERDSGI
jgi:hypothetical protein